jgi:hypothetical protein
VLGDLGDGEDALRRLRLRGARELQGRHLRQLDAALPERREERGAAGGIDELRGHERPANGKGGASELLDGADSLGGEQSLPLARFPAPEIAC